MKYYILKTEWDYVKKEFRILQKKVNEKDELLYFRETHIEDLKKTIVSYEKEIFDLRKKLFDVSAENLSLKTTLRAAIDMIDSRTRFESKTNGYVKSTDLYA